MQYAPEIVAQAYGSETYDGSDYQGSGSGSHSGNTTGGGGTTGNSTSTGAGASSNSSGGASLSNTGFDLAIIITLACFIGIVALVVRFWKKPKTNSNS